MGFVVLFFSGGCWLWTFRGDFFRMRIFGICLGVVGVGV